MKKYYMKVTMNIGFLANVLISPLSVQRKGRFEIILILRNNTIHTLNYLSMEWIIHIF